MSNKRQTKKTLLDGKEVTQNTYNQKMAAAEQERVDKLRKYFEAVAQAEEVLRGNLKLGEAGYAEWRQNAEAEIALYTNKTGEGLDDLLAKLGDVNHKAADSRNVLAKYAVGMSGDTKKANDAWNTMIFEPKTGEIKTNIPETIAEALKGKDGWDNMQFILKNANLTTNARFTVAEALIASGQWDQLSPEQKNLVINNQQGLLAIADSRQNMKIWNEMPDSVKKILGDNKDFIQNKEIAQQALTGWNTLPAQTKKLLGDDTDFLSKKGNATGALNSWNSMPENVKRLLGNDADFQNKKGAAASALKAWDAMPENVKRMFADNADVLSKKKVAADAITQWNSLSPKQQKLLAQNLTGDWVSKAKAAIDSLPKEKNTTLTTTHKNIFQEIYEKITKHATGTNYHHGRLAMVNDQKGSLYKELITLPTGQSFIPEGRDVVLNLPRGSSVLKASKTAQLIPKYANGTGGIPADAKIFRDMKTVQQQLIVNAPDIGSNARLDAILKALEGLKLVADNNEVITAVNRLAKRPAVSVFDADKASATLTSKITNQQNQKNLIESMLGGERP